MKKLWQMFINFLINNIFWIWCFLVITFVTDIIIWFTMPFPFAKLLVSSILAGCWSWIFYKMKGRYHPK
jgi:hypothetical protein